MNAAKNRGTRFESEVVRYLIDRGFVHAERRALHGARDRGDIAGIDGVCIEIKNQNRIQLAEWVDEATLEGHNASAEVAVVWHHRKGRPGAGHGYVTMTGEVFASMLRVLKAGSVGDEIGTAARAS